MNTPQAARAEDTIVIEGLRHRFDPQGGDVLCDVSVTMHAGAINGLAGPDGAGKTTLMRIMAGLLVPTAGKVRVAGLDPVRDVDRLHRSVGYMPQKFGLYEDLSVIENLRFYADLRDVTGDEREQQFKQLLQFTSLAKFTGRMAGKLSGGMKQKLGLACTLLGSPGVLLLDEPGVGVDPISRRELWHMVGTLAQQGMTVVWGTAYLEEAEQCDAICLMSAGKVLFAGAPAKQVERMQGRSVLVRDIEGNRRHVLQRAMRAPEVIDGVIQGSSVRLVLKEGGKTPALESLTAGAAARFDQVKPRLEDAFIDLLGVTAAGDSVLGAQMPQVRLPSDVDPEAVIEARRLTRRFGDFVATDHVSFKVRQGEIFGLIGPNGAGKSTTFKMMCGLLPPTSGDAHVMGIDLKTSASAARQRLGYMAQKFSLYGNLSVAQNLTFFSGIYGLRGARRKQKVDGMVQCFELERYLDTTTADMPLGYKQRLALACALMHEPQLLFLDEPTSGVDPVTRREFWSHINGLVDKGVTVMVTTHFMDEAEYCDRIGLVYGGRLIAIGTPDDLKQQVVDEALPEPSMEDAFIRLIERDDATRSKAEQAGQKSAATEGAAP